MLRELLNEGTDVEKVLKPALTRLNAYHVKMQSLKELMEDAITGMYLKLEGGNTSGILSPERK